MEPQSMKRELTSIEKSLSPTAYRLAPATWCPCSQIPHSAKSSFTLSTPSEGAHLVIRAAVAALQAEPPPEPSTQPLDFRWGAQVMKVHACEPGRVVLWHYTPRGWLDATILTLEAGATPGSTEVRVNDFATGFCPLTWPCCNVVNVLFCWIPFGGSSSSRIPYLQKEFEKHIASL